MLKSSKTWPSILTMAVVQLKFDQKGKYSYSTIANINQSHKLIEAHISVPNGHSSVGDNKWDATCQHNGDHKKDLITRKNVKSRSVAANRATANGRPQNGFISVNGGSTHCATSPGHNGKVCLCELGFRDNRKRSESIKVDNWDFIYKEKSFRTNVNVSDDNGNATPK